MPIVRVERVSKRFVKTLDLAAKIASRLGAGVVEEVVHAVDDVSFSVHEREVGSRPFCSSVNRLFFIGSLSGCGSHSLKLRLVLRTWAGHYCRR